MAPRHLGIDEHRYRWSVRFFQDLATKAWTRYEPWMSTIVGLDTGQVLGIVDGRDSTGVGNWLFKKPLEWRLGVQVVAIDPSAAFHKALRMWLPRAAVSVDHFHIIMLANQALTDARQRLTQETNRLETVFAVDDPTGKLEAAWRVKEQVRAMLRTDSLEDGEIVESLSIRQVLLSLSEAVSRQVHERLVSAIDPLSRQGGRPVGG